MTRFWTITVVVIVAVVVIIIIIIIIPIQMISEFEFTACVFSDVLISECAAKVVTEFWLMDECKV